MSRPSKSFSAQYDSHCGGGDFITEDEEIVMWDGEAWHEECADKAGAFEQPDLPDPYR